MTRWCTAVRRAVAGVMIVPLLLVAISFTHDLMRCRLTGVVIPDGACPDTATIEISHARLDAPGCCERQAAQSSVVTARPDTRNVEVLEAPRLLVLAFPQGIAGFVAQWAQRRKAGV